uniref:Uncharacterized protein n=1 Tax=Astatotilapia calliptera TaxID=8154 RepID=A0A3P8PK71_ASTCA
PCLQSDCLKEEAAFKHMNLILFAKHGGGYVMAWGSFSASGLECLLLLKISMNFQLNQQILEEKKQSEKKMSCKEMHQHIGTEAFL